LVGAIDRRLLASRSDPARETACNPRTKTVVAGDSRKANVRPTEPEVFRITLTRALPPVGGAVISGAPPLGGDVAPSGGGAVGRNGRYPLAMRLLPARLCCADAGPAEGLTTVSNRGCPRVIRKTETTALEVSPLRSNRKRPRTPLAMGSCSRSCATEARVPSERAIALIMTSAACAAAMLKASGRVPIARAKGWRSDDRPAGGGTAQGRGM
jgi:hypothetical protein